MRDPQCLSFYLPMQTVEDVKKFMKDAGILYMISKTDDGETRRLWFRLAASAKSGDFYHYKSLDVDPNLFNELKEQKVV